MEIEPRPSQVKSSHAMPCEWDGKVKGGIIQFRICRRTVKLIILEIFDLLGSDDKRKAKQARLRKET